MIEITTETDRIVTHDGVVGSGTLLVVNAFEFEYDEGETRRKVSPGSVSIKIADGKLSGTLSLAPTQGANHDRANLTYTAYFQIGNRRWSEHWVLDQTDGTTIEITDIKQVSVAGVPAYVSLAASLTAADVSYDGGTVKSSLDSLAADSITSAERTKLGGIATGATANQTDAHLLDRTNHTGSQAAATISDFTATARSAVRAQDVGLGSVDNTADADKPVSTAQQSAIDAVKNKIESVTYTASHTLTAADIGRMLVFDSASAVTLTIPDAILSADNVIALLNIGAGNLTVAGGTGVTVTVHSSDTRELDGAAATASIWAASATQCYLSGKLVAA